MFEILDFNHSEILYKSLFNRSIPSCIIRVFNEYVVNPIWPFKALCRSLTYQTNNSLKIGLRDTTIYIYINKYNYLC